MACSFDSRYAKNNFNTKQVSPLLLVVSKGKAMFIKRFSYSESPVRKLIAKNAIQIDLFTMGKRSTVEAR